MKGDENLRLVYIKPLFEILSGFLSLLIFMFSKSTFMVSSKRRKFFSGNMASGVSKNPSFHSDFKNVRYILQKVACRFD